MNITNDSQTNPLQVRPGFARPPKTGTGWSFGGSKRPRERSLRGRRIPAPRRRPIKASHSRPSAPSARKHAEKTTANDGFGAHAAPALDAWVSRRSNASPMARPSARFERRRALRNHGGSMTRMRAPGAPRRFDRILGRALALAPILSATEPAACPESDEAPAFAGASWSAHQNVMLQLLI